MIGLATGTRIWIVAGVTDLRRGFVGPGGMVQTALAGESRFPDRFCVSREARRSGQVALVGWRRAVLVREAAGARAIHLAAKHQRDRFVDARAVVDVAGRDRLAAAVAQFRSADGGVSELFLVVACIFIML